MIFSSDSSICQRYPVQSFDQSQNCCLCQKFAHFWETEIGNHCHGQWHWPRRQRYRYQVLQTVGRLEKFPLGSGMLACRLWSSGLMKLFARFEFRNTLFWRFENWSNFRKQSVFKFEFNKKMSLKQVAHLILKCRYNLFQRPKIDLLWWTLTLKSHILKFSRKDIYFIYIIELISNPRVRDSITHLTMLGSFVMWTAGLGLHNYISHGSIRSLCISKCRFEQLCPSVSSVVEI